VTVFSCLASLTSTGIPGSGSRFRCLARHKEHSSCSTCCDFEVVAPRDGLNQSPSIYVTSCRPFYNSGSLFGTGMVVHHGTSPIPIMVFGTAWDDPGMQWFHPCLEWAANIGRERVERQRLWGLAECLSHPAGPEWVLHILMPIPGYLFQVPEKIARKEIARN
jgi:hypothetical protein